MDTCTKILWLPKHDCSDTEYQDAFATNPIDDDGYCQDPIQLFAVADGASEAIFSGLWANLLVDSWVNTHNEVFSLSDGSIKRLAETWQANLPIENLPWWAEEKIRAGSFSTFAGLRLSTTEEYGCRWEFTAVGDSCLFIFRDSTFHYVSPLTKSVEFNSSPYLIASEPQFNTELNEHIITDSGEVLEGDEFILATDALAYWILSKLERDASQNEIFRFLEVGDNKGEFSRCIAAARLNGEMRNDDVTFLSVYVLKT